MKGLHGRTILPHCRPSALDVHHRELIRASPRSPPRSAITNDEAHPVVPGIARRSATTRPRRHLLRSRVLFRHSYPSPRQRYRRDRDRAPSRTSPSIPIPRGGCPTCQTKTSGVCSEITSKGGNFLNLGLPHLQYATKKEKGGRHL